MRDVIQEDIEAAWDEAWLNQTDKAWDAIHRCLTDGRLAIDSGAAPLNLVILGGEQLHRDATYFVCFVPSKSVPSIVEALTAFSRAAFDRAFDNLSHTDYEGPRDADDREFTWDSIESLREFFRKAADARRSVVFTVDQ